MLFIIIVMRSVVFGLYFKSSHYIPKKRVGGKALSKCRAVNNGFKRRAGLARAKRNIYISIHCFVKIIAAANHSQNLPGFGILSNQGRVFSLILFFIVLRSLFYFFFGNLL